MSWNLADPCAADEIVRASWTPEKRALATMDVIVGEGSIGSPADTLHYAPSCLLFVDDQAHWDSAVSSSDSEGFDPRETLCLLSYEEE